MKKFKNILIFCLLNYYLTEIVDECTANFENIIINKCESRDSKCAYDPNFTPSCIRFSNCDDSEAYQNRDICRHTISKNIYSGKRCGFYSYCQEDQRYCTDYKFPNGVFDEMKEDNCEILRSNCRLLADGTCRGGTTSDCSSIAQVNCQYFISSRTKKCIWNEQSSSCVETDRYCYDAVDIIYDKEQCSELKTSNSKKKCIYNKENLILCKEVYPVCEHYSQSDCNKQTPLNVNGNDYDNLYKCQYDTSKNKCIKVNKNCNDFNSILGDDENMCLSFISTDPINKVCVFINGK